jgi:SAM-dependent methyltransferase
MPQTVDVAAFARLTGATLRAVQAMLDGLGIPPLRYRPLAAAERSAVLADFEATVTQKTLRVVGDDDPAIWERGWGELAERVRGTEITLESLRPQYFHDGAPCRLFGDLVMPATADFEYWVGLGIRWLAFDEFLRDRRRIVEFGCGTGINLLLLSRLLPEARLVGCDWARASQRIVGEMARQTGDRIEGQRFNMLVADGWDGGEIDGSTAVLTVHALEQLSSGWRPFLEYLLARRPGLCLHLEPLVELYDEQRPLDALASRYHRKRRYLEGFLPAVEELAAEGRAEILARRRTSFGGLYHESYSILAWRPVLPGDGHARSSASPRRIEVA